MSGLRAITVQNPWGETIAPGGKTIENRGRGALGWKWREWLLIHVGVRWSERGALDPRVRAYWDVPGLGRGQHRYALRLEGEKHPPGPFLERSGVALCLLEDIHLGAGCCEPWGEEEYRDCDGSLRSEVVHLVLDHVWRLPEPIGIERGALGLWDPGEDVAWECMRQALEHDWPGLDAIAKADG